MTKLYKPFAVAATFTLLVAGGFLAFLSATDYQPAPRISLNIENAAGAQSPVRLHENLVLVTTNVGYGAMDDEMDFFYDGGTQSRAKDKDRAIRNVSGLIFAIQAVQPDFIFAQEIDLASTRSYDLNEYDYFKQAFERHSHSFAISFNIPWIPVPITQPHGRVLAGMANFANGKTLASERLALPIEESFPSRLWALDNCLLKSRIAVENGKELVLLNAHLSAYDKGGSVRERQLALILKTLAEESAQGNYVILGGDFNQGIPGSDPQRFPATEPTPDWYMKIPESFNPPGFHWAFDPDIPTNRTAGTPYVKGQNFLSTIDGFMVSDNIEVVKVTGMDQQFKYTDHHPVTLIFRLK